MLIINSRLVLPGRVEQGGISIEGDRIAGIFSQDEAPAGIQSSDVIDAAGAYLAPGFVDIHIHGSTNVDVQRTDGSGLATLSSFLLSHGITGYFATFVPASERDYSDAVWEINSYVERDGSEDSPASGA